MASLLFDTGYRSQGRFLYHGAIESEVDYVTPGIVTEVVDLILLVPVPG